MPTMVGTGVRRAVDWAVLAFAAYAFVSVPLGKRTAWQHVRAIFSTQESAEAGREIKQAGEKLVQRLTAKEQTAPLPVRGEPVLPEIAPAQLHLEPLDLDEEARDEGEAPDASL